ncbi:MAG: helix-turn-helix domain-containing protein [Candidatus Aegiribacteria sp.]|nr:helix-turn-helix domain-containing protein [Candidatus Aegiribacteria sp.]
MLPSNNHNSKHRKTYRNPIIYAQELQDEMKREGLTQAELARKLGISRARVNQWLSLLKLPIRETEKVLAMGDNWNRQLVTERQLRTLTNVFVQLSGSYVNVM